MAQPDPIQVLANAVASLDDCVRALASSFPNPELVKVGQDQVKFRHRYQGDLLLSYLKAIKIASTNNAALLLLRAGYVQEVYALCRIMDEAGEDIQFMAQPLGEGGEPSKDQNRFFNEFYQEEFDDPDDPLSSATRDRVSRRAIRAALGRFAAGAGIDSSKHQAIGKTLYATFSGFVHGAYVHIMELFGGNPPLFHTRGMLNTPRMSEAIDNHANYVYRSLIAVEHVAIRAYRPEVVKAVVEAHIALAKATGCISPAEIERTERRRDRPLVRPA
jgi:hypothetical protein